MSSSDSSISENVALPPNQNGGGSIAHSGPTQVGDQNSAGKYPLISKPMQISTRVGVVQVIRRLP
jgi:hypothetical protein